MGKRRRLAQLVKPGPRDPARHYTHDQIACDWCEQSRAAEQSNQHHRVIRHQTVNKNLLIQSDLVNAGASALPFREIIGVEIWPEMVSIAEENLRKYRGNRACRVARLHCLDASEYSIPADPGVFYFFDPFRETVTRKVLENLRQSLLVHPREVYVIYCEPERPDLLDNCGFLALLKRTEHYSIYGSAKVPG